MIYKPTIKELEIFCGYTPEEFSEPCEVLEHASRLAKIDPGFVGFGQDAYYLYDGETELRIEVFFDDYTSLELFVDDVHVDSIYDFYEVYENHDYDYETFKGYMFRLVLLWMKQQGEK